MDTVTRNKLVEQLLPIVEKTVKRFIRARPSSCVLRADLEQDASLTLIEAVDKCPELENVEAYVTTSIYNRLLDSWNKQDCGELRAHRVVLSRAIDDLDSEIEQVDDQDELDALLEQRDQLCNAAVESLIILPEDKRNERGVTELWSDIIDCCESDDEERIVRMRASGMTDSEIGDEIGVCQQTVSRIRKKIEARFIADA